MEEVNISGIRYISSKRASEMSGYSQDYIGQLARSGAIEAKRLSGLWYISLESLGAHKEKAGSYVPQPPQKKTVASTQVHDSSISLEGKAYMASGQAAKLTGYNQDYVTQLAREGKIPSKQVGGRWYVEREAIIRHKSEKDALLAAVQAESVGIQKREVPQLKIDTSVSADVSEPITYFKEGERDLMPVLNDTAKNIVNPAESDMEVVARDEAAETHQVPIKIVRTTPGSGSTIAARPQVLIQNTSRSQTDRRGRYTALLATGAVAASIFVFIAYVYPLSESIAVTDANQIASTSQFIDAIGDFLEELMLEEVTFSR